MESNDYIQHVLNCYRGRLTGGEFVELEDRLNRVAAIAANEVFSRYAEATQDEVEKAVIRHRPKPGDLFALTYGKKWAADTFLFHASKIPCGDGVAVLVILPHGKTLQTVSDADLARMGLARVDAPAVVEDESA